jgi:hypothetical protein
MLRLWNITLEYLTVNWFEKYRNEAVHVSLKPLYNENHADI